MFKKLHAWFVFCRYVWGALISGWCILLLSYTPYMRLDRAGAFMVCSAILAEIFHNKRYRKFVEHVQPGTSITYTYTVEDVPNENRKNIIACEHRQHSGNVIINSEQWTLFHLVKESEFYELSGETKWSINATMDRVDKTIDYFIAFTAVIGTILWAYGN